jgi:hypothetical protein
MGFLRDVVARFDIINGGLPPLFRGLRQCGCRGQVRDGGKCREEEQGFFHGRDFNQAGGCQHAWIGTVAVELPGASNERDGNAMAVWRRFKPIRWFQ